MWFLLHQQELKLPPWPPQICTIVDMIELQLLDQAMKFFLLLPSCDNEMNCFFLFLAAHRFLMSTSFFSRCFLMKIFFFFCKKNPENVFSTYIAYTTGFLKKKKKRSRISCKFIATHEVSNDSEGWIQRAQLATFLPWWCLTTRKSGQHDREVDFCFLGKLVVLSEVADVHVQVFITQLEGDPKVATDSTCRITEFSVFHVR